MNRRLLLLVLLLAAPSARAWDSLGHMIVGQIAYEQLTPAAKAAVDEALVRFNEAKRADFTPPDVPYSAMTAGCWMDDIRALPDKYEFGPWHYVNLPFNREGLPVPDGEAQPNVIWGIDRCADILAGRATDPAIDRDQAMVMLFHLVADVHQPLHTTTRNDDAGGNKVPVPNLEPSKADLAFSKKRTGSLHAFWDSAYRRVFRNGEVGLEYEVPELDPARPVSSHDSSAEIVRREAADIAGRHPSTDDAGAGGAEAWARESHGIGFDFAYGKLPADSDTGVPTELDGAYVEQARDISRERLALAGHRLAAMLNAAFASPAP
jgi:hypothetical protein